MKNTILSKQQQKIWLEENVINSTLIANYTQQSVKIYNMRKTEVLSKAKGQGYDRFAEALGLTIVKLFSKELESIIKREKLGSLKKGQQVGNYPGFFVNKDGQFYIDGSYGRTCVEKILHKIGFQLKYVTEDVKNTIYILQSVNS